jgi:hypothetical protein
MQDSGKTVSAVGTGTISWADLITLSVIQQTPSGVRDAHFPYDPINGGAYINGNLVQENSTVSVNPNESCVLSVSLNEKEGPFTYYIYVNNVLVASGDWNDGISYTFSPAENTTIGFGAGSSKK